MSGARRLGIAVAGSTLLGVVLGFLAIPSPPPSPAGAPGTERSGEVLSGRPADGARAPASATALARSVPSRLGEKPGGLAEGARRAVFQDAVRAQIRARREAEATVRDADLTSPDVRLDGFVRRLEKRQHLAGLLQEKYLRHVAAQHGLSYEEVEGLLQEGLANNWPRP